MKRRLDFRGNRRINRVLYMASVNQRRDLTDARLVIGHRLSEGRPDARPARPTNDTSQPHHHFTTASSDAFGRRISTTRTARRECPTVPVPPADHKHVSSQFQGWTIGPEPGINSFGVRLGVGLAGGTR